MLILLAKHGVIYCLVVVPWLPAYDELRTLLPTLFDQSYEKLLQRLRMEKCTKSINSFFYIFFCLAKISVLYVYTCGSWASYL